MRLTRSACQRLERQPKKEGRPRYPPGAPILLEIEPLKLLNPLPIRVPGELETVQQAISFIDRNVPRELATLPRWTFARALLVEARKTRNYETCGLPPAQSGIQQ